MHSQRKGTAAADLLYAHSKTEQLEAKVRQLEAGRLKLRDEVNDTFDFSLFVPCVPEESVFSVCEFPCVLEPVISV